MELEIAWTWFQRLAVVASLFFGAWRSFTLRTIPEVVGGWMGKGRGVIHDSRPRRRAVDWAVFGVGVAILLVLAAGTFWPDDDLAMGFAGKYTIASLNAGPGGTIIVQVPTIVNRTYKVIGVTWGCEFKPHGSNQWADLSPIMSLDQPLKSEQSGTIINSADLIQQKTLLRIRGQQALTGFLICRLPDGYGKETVLGSSVAVWAKDEFGKTYRHETQIPLASTP